MMIKIDLTTRAVIVGDGSEQRTISFASPEAFEIVSKAWLNAGWDAKYVYSFSWFGRPIIQLPEDMIRIQEVIYALKPDVIVETGVAHGGSLVFYASLFEAIGNGRVIGVDIEIRPHNRRAIESHHLFHRITLIEGSSVSPKTLAAVRSQIALDDKVLVVLDSNHTRDHVLAELEQYGPLVSPGSYIIACDGIMAEVVGGPRTQSDWSVNNPISAVNDFVAKHPQFTIEEPAWPFNEGAVQKRVTYWPRAFVKRNSSQSG
jgi:cephalosporin hydroxylase